MSVEISAPPAPPPKPMREVYRYHRTKSGHDVFIDKYGKSGPVLITFHGGGIVLGCRVDGHAPEHWTNNWPGVTIRADYRLLVPSSGLDILEDMKALFEFLVTLDIEHHQIFVAGFSGGGYPTRLAAIVGAEEAKKPNPRFRIIGAVSYCGMGGDVLDDHWVFSQEDPEKQLGDDRTRSEQATQAWQDGGEECSSSGWEVEYQGLPVRTHIWRTFHLNGSINDSYSGIQGLSDKLRELPHEQRLAAIPKEALTAYPQAYFAEDPSHLPPFLLIHGDQDNVVPFGESQNTYDTLKRAGHPVELWPLKGANHGLFEEQPVIDGVLEHDRKSLAWMLAIVKQT
ncbi:Alpha/Beta hydrolase protein [Kockovaella imperatae]|uniref:Alpha/Beta hydrolase protein n=1 Tax=Kockovaella imperatae TaxID=4999 RepID=A0A1Y1U897_9TREE|nr:Alpha/Beta hydrolase protein [Kockovaella imperatae]ORX34260.1 Alpha/Beta hydrolase protein [Kockovaella imperatae]